MSKQIFQPHELQELDTALGGAITARTRATHAPSFDNGYLAGCEVGRQEERAYWLKHLEANLKQLTRFKNDLATRVPYTPGIDAPTRITNDDVTTYTYPKEAA